MPDATAIDWSHRYRGRSRLGRLMNRIDYRNPSGCWNWTGSTNDDGYGRVTAGDQHFHAHRLMFALWYGPIPAGTEIDHICKVRSCVNPEHLEPITHHENVLRGDSPTALNARATHCPRGHEYTPENRYFRPGQTNSHCRACIYIRTMKYNTPERQREYRARRKQREMDEMEAAVLDALVRGDSAHIAHLVLEGLTAEADAYATDPIVASRIRRWKEARA